MALSRLIWKNFFSRVFEPTMAFILPLVIYFILRFLVPFGEASNYSKINYLIPGMSLYIPMVLGLMVLPVQLMQFKESVIIKRIGTTPIKPRFLTATFVLNYVVLGILGVLFFVTVASLVELGTGLLGGSEQQLVKETDEIKRINSLLGINDFTFGRFETSSFLMNGEGIGYFILFNLVGNFLSIMVGMLICAISKNLPMAQGLSALIFWPSMFLTGMFFPLSISNDDGLGFLHMIPWRSLSILQWQAWWGSGSDLALVNPVEASPITDNLFGLSSDNLGVGDIVNTWISLGVVGGALVSSTSLALWKFKWVSNKS